MSRGFKSGFTLIEAMVTVALVAVGVVGVIGGFGALTASQTRAQESERMQRLAFQKYDELLATQGTTLTDLGGDFADQGQAGLKWEASVQPTGVENLDSITVTVSRMNDSGGPLAQAEGLSFRPPAATGGTTP